MKKNAEAGLSNHLTFKGNLKHTRYGWLRLTPAHSVHLVSEMLDRHEGRHEAVLDPFCGTGTTALVCAQRGIASATTDINPFLLWLTRAKTRSYSEEVLTAFRRAALEVSDAIQDKQRGAAWTPPLHQIEKWWDTPTLHALSRAMCVIQGVEDQAGASANVLAADLLKIAFCGVMIERSNASFGHQSMSFKKRKDDAPSLFTDDALSNSVDAALLTKEMARCWSGSVERIMQAACGEVAAPPQTLLCDARQLSAQLEPEAFSCVITSPPYPNRMSYIRELRPYMYWLGYLQDGREAGELDWKAIGGTWGCATSNVGRWEPEEKRRMPYAGFDEILMQIAETSPLLSRYVHKYFYDMVDHIREVFKVVKPSGNIYYIVGNSKFYDVMLPVEAIYASMFENAGFTNVITQRIRKRTSKKELFEFVVSARKP